MPMLTAETPAFPSLRAGALELESGFLACHQHRLVYRCSRGCCVGLPHPRSSALPCAQHHRVPVSRALLLRPSCWQFGVEHPRSTLYPCVARAPVLLACATGTHNTVGGRIELKMQVLAAAAAAAAAAVFCIVLGAGRMGLQRYAAAPFLLCNAGLPLPVQGSGDGL